MSVSDVGSPRIMLCPPHLISTFSVLSVYYECIWCRFLQNYVVSTTFDYERIWYRFLQKHLISTFSSYINMLITMVSIYFNRKGGGIFFWKKKKDNQSSKKKKRFDKKDTTKSSSFVVFKGNFWYLCWINTDF